MRGKKKEGSRVNTKAAHNRHQRRIQKAAEARAEIIANGPRRKAQVAQDRQDKIDKKAKQRRAFASLSYGQKIEHSAAGREHRRPKDFSLK